MISIVLLQNTLYFFKGGGRKNKGRDSDSSGERPVKGRKQRKEKPKKFKRNSDEGLSAKQKSKIVSKATISTSEDSDDGKLM